MKPLSFTCSELHLPLKVNWKLSRNETKLKTNLILQLEYENKFYFGEVAFNIRYGETLENSLQQFEQIAFGIKKLDLNSALNYLDENSYNNSLKCGFEQCLLKALCDERRCTLYEFFSLDKPSPVNSFFTIPIMPCDQIQLYYDENNLQKYSGIKLKVNQHSALDLIKQTLQVIQSDQKILVDANEAFSKPDELISLMNQFKNQPILCFEQPFAKEMHPENLQVAKKNIFPIMADESIEDVVHFDHLTTGFDYINVKIMKTGGLRRAVQIIQEAKTHGLKIMMGCMIETSLSISYAWQVSSIVDLFDLDGPLLLAKDPFKQTCEKYLSHESS